jgi:hypothetical protein
LFLPHAQSILELIQRCLADEERTDTLVKLAFGLVGDLADSFPNGQLKQLLLQEWIANELRNRRGLSPETRKTMRWAKEVSSLLDTIHTSLILHAILCTDDQAGNRIDNFLFSSFPSRHDPFPCMQPKKSLFFISFFHPLTRHLKEAIVLRNLACNRRLSTTPQTESSSAFFCARYPSCIHPIPLSLKASYRFPVPRVELLQYYCCFLTF